MIKKPTRWVVSALLMAILVTLWLPAAVSAEGISKPPHAFYGNLSHTDGSPAAAGVVVSAAVNGIPAGRITTTKSGQYGSENNQGSPNLLVQGDFPDGAIVHFFVNGMTASTAETVYYKAQSESRVDLVYTPPTHQFYGSLTHTDGSPARSGVTVTARINDTVFASLTTSETGKYGGATESEPKLIIQDDIADGAQITFFVNGIPASPNTTFKAQTVTQLDLTYTAPQHRFYGTLTRADNKPVPSGSILTAKINGDLYATLTTTQAGQYGGPASGDPKLVIQDDIADGSTISFYLNDQPLSPEYTFKNQSVTELNLVYTPPAQKFYGTLTRTNGTQVPAGVTVTAKINETVYASLTTTEAGKYGGPSAGEPKLVIQDDIADGTSIVFLVEGYTANPGAVFSAGQTTELNLTYTVSSGSSGGGGSTTTAPSTTTTSIPVVTTNPTSTSTTPVTSATPVQLFIELSGKSYNTTLSAAGNIQQGLVITPDDQSFKVEIPAGVKLNFPSGSQSRITIKSMTPPPAPPAGWMLAGPVYECLPSSLTFDPAFNLSFRYVLPSGSQAADLSAAIFADGKWTMLDKSNMNLNTAEQNATLRISHFSAYGLLAPAKTTPTQAANLTPAVTTQTSSTTLNVVVSSPAASTTTSIPASGISGWLIAVIVIAVVIILVIVVVVVRRKPQH